VELIEGHTRIKTNLPDTRSVDLEATETEINTLTSELDIILQKEANMLSLKAGINVSSIV
jgi:hypothetical protein